MRQSLKIGVIVLVVAALAAGGLALAQTGEEPEYASEPIPVEETRIYQHLLERLAPLVEDGTITQGQAEAVAAQLAPEGRRPRPRVRRGRAILGKAAEFLGLSREELVARLAEGATLAEIAEENGLSAAELVDGLVTAVGEKVKAAVEEGRITQEQVDEILARAEERLAQLVEHPAPRRRDFRHGPRHGVDRGTDVPQFP
ncbi:MAG: hypothetical protein ACE5KX_08095 [Acidimicrobiia bacterium]